MQALVGQTIARYGALDIDSIFNNAGIELTGHAGSEMREGLASQNPNGRLARPDEIADAVLFFGVRCFLLRHWRILEN